MKIYTFLVLLPICLTISCAESKKNKTTAEEIVQWQDGPNKRSSDKPNLIIIFIDDMGFNDVSTYGGGLANGQFKTPNIDQLAAEGVLCTNGYSANAVCSPSRASLLTGRYSTRFGYEFTPSGSSMAKNLAESSKNDLHPAIYDAEKEKSLIPYQQMGVPESEIMLPELLKTQGYHNVHIGKWHLGETEQFIPINQGFDESLYLPTGGLFLPEDDPNVVNKKLDFSSIDKTLWASLKYKAKFNDRVEVTPKGYLTNYFTDQAVEVIEKNKNRPFFLYMAYWGVHTPLQAYKEYFDQLDYIENHTERVHAAMVMAVDKGVGRIKQALKDNGIADNTMIVFSSDNGSPSYLGLPNVNNPYRGWKLTYFEGGVHIPYIVHYPEKIPTGKTYDKRVSNLDIYSTFAAVAGATLPNDRIIDGVNLMPFLNGANKENPHDNLHFKIGTNSVIIKEGWKLYIDYLQNKKWLFNLNTDPTEQNNLAEKETKTVEELTELIEKHNADQAKPIWPSVIQMPEYIDKPLNTEVNKADEYIYWPN